MNANITPRKVKQVTFTAVPTHLQIAGATSSRKAISLNSEGARKYPITISTAQKHNKISVLNNCFLLEKIPITANRTSNNTTKITKRYKMLKHQFNAASFSENKQMNEADIAAIVIINTEIFAIFFINLSIVIIFKYVNKEKLYQFIFCILQRYPYN